MRIQHNIPALNTFRQMGVNNTGTSKALEKLSTGLRINRAGDDAAGLAISEKMRAQIVSLNRASTNAQDGVSLIQSADGALQEVHNILDRMRELSIQAANDTNQEIDREAIQGEITQLTKEIDRIANTTEFNKMTVLDGSLKAGKYIKSISGFNISGIELLNASTAINGITSVNVAEPGEKLNMTFDFTLTGEDPSVVQGKAQIPTNLQITLSDDVATAAGIEQRPAMFAIAINEGDTASIVAGNIRDMLQNALGADWNVTSTGSKVTIEGKYAGNFGPDSAFYIEEAPDQSGVFDPSEWDSAVTGENAWGTQGKDVLVYIDGEPAEFTNANFIGWDNEPETGALRWTDTTARLYLGTGEEGSSPSEQFSFKIDDPTKNSGAIISTMLGRNLALQVGANDGYDQTVVISVDSLSATSLGIAELNMLSHKDAQNAIISVDTAKQRVSDQRGALGAVQNRLEHSIANIDTVSENLQDAESRIRDTDVAKEMMNFTKFSILMQSAQSMMAQANSLPQGVLQLLK